MSDKLRKEVTAAVQAATGTKYCNGCRRWRDAGGFRLPAGIKTMRCATCADATDARAKAARMTTTTKARAAGGET